MTAVKNVLKKAYHSWKKCFRVCQVLGVWDSFTERHRCLKMVLWLLDFPVESVRQRMLLTDVSTMPVKCIRKFQQNVTNISASADNTVLIDFCSGNDECVLATMESVLKSKKTQLTGGTAWEGLVCCNGQVYEDACAYALVKNESGRVKVYKENIYLRKDAVKHIVTKSEPRTYTIQEIDGKRAEDVYTKELGISPENITEQTMVNPLGRVIGDETYIISIKERTGNAAFPATEK